MTVHRVCFGATTLVTLLAYRNLFVDPPEGGLLRAGLPGLTQVVVASGVGTLLGAVLTPVITRRISARLWITVLLAGGAFIELGFGLPYEKLTFLLAGFALGVVSQGSKISVDTLVQRTVDDAFRGRVFSVYDTLFNVAFVAAAALAAAVLPPDGVSRPLLVGLALLYAAAAGGYAYASRDRQAADPPQ
jgi:predicted MFS family arabinose efflux permease